MDGAGMPEAQTPDAPHAASAPAPARFHLSDELSAELYGELRRISGAYFRNESIDNTLQPTAVAHEAYLRLARRNHGGWPSREEFLAAAAQTVRRVLVDHARARNRKKRGGEFERSSLDVADVMQPGSGVDLVDLNDALTRLADVSPRCARIVELRFFGGLTVEETAAAIGASAATVSSDWTLAQAWLHREMNAAETA